MAPGYLSELCTRVAANPAQSRLRSATHGDLDYPYTNTKFGDRAFAVTGPKSWNKLKPATRNLNNLQHFKSELKTHLFDKQ